MHGIRATIRDNKYLRWVLVLTNWCFQGILHADRTEKFYKISFTLLGSGIIGILFYTYSELNILIIIVGSFFIAHTVNWVVNGNFTVIIIHRLMLSSISKEQLLDYLNTLENRLNDKEWLLYCASFGSICRGELKDSSDIDISIVRKPGFQNGIAAILFSVKEKKYADFKGIPLEIYISDTPANSIHRFRGEQNPVVISDPDSVIDTYYNEKLSFADAKKLNTES